MLDLKRTKKPRKPHQSYPLTAHNNGQWCKKILGKIHFFGVWADPSTALENYLRVAADLHAGRQPVDRNISVGGMTVKDVCNHFLTYQHDKVRNGDIAARSFDECRRIAEKFAQIVGSARPVTELVPEDFRRFRQRLVQVGFKKRGKGLGVYALSRTITIVRGMFKYAWDMDLIEKPIKFGKALEKPSATLVRKSRQISEQENGKRMFEAQQIIDLCKTASPTLRAMILLAVNGGYGNTDCSRLPISVINLEEGLIDYGRIKTGIERVVPLWPETTAAMKEALALRPKAANEAADRLFFLTATGQPWVREHIHWSEGDSAHVKKVVITDDICREFSSLLIQLSIKRKGVGFYALRHTFRTFADEVKDPHAIHRIMGHAIPGMSGVYVEKIEVYRLRAVVDHVRAKLFGSPTQVSSGQDAPGQTH